MRLRLPIFLLLAALGTTPPGMAGPCTGFKWDISKEIALFGGPSLTLPAGADAASAASITADRLYELRLIAQGSVAFALPPGRASANEGAYAGLADLRLDTPGNYRIAVDAPLWIDVVADGKLAAVSDFQAQPSCDGPRKIVEFDLSGARRFLLQLSGSPATNVRVTITRTPPRKL